MSDTLQTFWLSALDKILSNLPAIIAAAAAAWVVVVRSNKKTEEKGNETNRIVQRNTDEQNRKLEAVHETVNGNYTALQAKYDAALATIAAQHEQLSARAAKRSTDP